MQHMIQRFLYVTAMYNVAIVFVMDYLSVSVKSQQVDLVSKLALKFVWRKKSNPKPDGNGCN